MPALQLDQMGIPHFSFTVPDTEALLDELLAKGVQPYLTMRQNSHALYQHRSVSYALSEPALSGRRRATAPPTAASQTVSLDVQGAEVRDVLRLLAETGGVNILTSAEVQGTVTARLLDVPWEQALAAILTLTGLAQAHQGNVILVAPAERLRSARQERLQARQVDAQAEQKITRLVLVNYAKASELKTHLEKLLGACASISVDNRTNTLILTGTPSCLRVWEGAR